MKAAALALILGLASGYAIGHRPVARYVPFQTAASADSDDVAALDTRNGTLCNPNPISANVLPKCGKP